MFEEFLERPSENHPALLNDLLGLFIQRIRLLPRPVEHSYLVFLKKINKKRVRSLTERVPNNSAPSSSLSFVTCV